jgi:hypothetical protein
VKIKRTTETYLRKFVHTCVAGAPYRRETYAKLVMALAVSQMSMTKVSLEQTGIMASVSIECNLEGTDEQYDLFQRHFDQNIAQ